VNKRAFDFELLLSSNTSGIPADYDAPVAQCSTGKCTV